MPIDNGNLALKGLDDLFSTEENRQEEQREQVQQIPIDDLHPFTNHPFKVLDDEAMTRTVESIAQYGVLAPLIARPRPDGDGYEIISGHRRQYAAKLAGLDTLPVIVRQMSDDAAVILMVDSNLQREHILPSERAFAYKMKLEALKNQGARSDLTSDQVGQKLWSVEQVANDAGESKTQIQRFIRLTSLIPELLDFHRLRRLFHYCGGVAEIHTAAASDLPAAASAGRSDHGRLYRRAGGRCYRRYLHGNLLVGPTAIDVDDKEATATTAAGLDEVREKSGLAVKDIPLRQTITSFAGLRAHEARHDFFIGEIAPGFVDCAAIESPGLSSAPAIGAMVADIVRGSLHLHNKPDFDPTRRGILDPKALDLAARAELIRQNPAYGQIICRCESVTEGEIIDAIRRTPGARSLDGVKRRTRAGMGRCQAGFCSPRVMEILARELGVPQSEITKSGGASKIIVGTNKDSL